MGTARHIAPVQLDALADRYMGIQSAEEQLKAGLVDTLVYRQDMDSLLRVYTGTKDYNVLTTGKLALVKRPASKANCS